MTSDSVGLNVPEKTEAKIVGKRAGFKVAGRWVPWLLVAPALLVIFAFSLFPLGYALVVSFKYYCLTNLANTAWIGLDNYRKALSDPFVWEAVKKTVFFTVVALAIEMPLGTGIAFLLHRKFRGQSVVRTLLLVPMACAPLAIGLIWRSMYHPEFGAITYLTKLLGFKPPNFLGDSSTAMFSIIAFDVWQWTPFITFIVLAGLQALRREPYEAAEIDGASGWQVFRKLTLPMLTPLLLVAFLLRLLDLIRYYDGIYALTMGGPGTATETLSWYLYRVGFKYLDMGYASAVSLIFLYAAIILSVMTIRSISRVTD